MRPPRLLVLAAPALLAACEASPTPSPAGPGPTAPARIVDRASFRTESVVWPP